MMTITIVVVLLVGAGLASHLFGPSVLARHRERREVRRTERAEQQRRGRAARQNDLARRDAEHKEQQERENALVRRHPHDFAARAGYRLRARLSRWTHRRAAVNREIELVEVEIERAAPEHAGIEFGIRALCAVLVPLMIAGSLVLNVLIFLALNGDNGGTASVVGAVAKGALFTVTEVAMAAAVAWLYRQRENQTVWWKISVWATLLTLALCLAGVVYYAPARSHQVWAPTLQADQVLLAEVRAQRPPDEAAITAQQATLDVDIARREDDATSDIVMACVLPLAEILCFHLALEGARALRRRQFRTRRERRRAELVRTRDEIDETVETEKDKGVAEIVDALIAAGHTDVGRYLAGPQPGDRPDAPGRRSVPAGPASAHGPAPDDHGPDEVRVPDPRAPEPPPEPETPSGPISLRVIRRPDERPQAERDDGPARTVIDAEPPTARHRARPSHPENDTGHPNPFDIVGSG